MAGRTYCLTKCQVYNILDRTSGRDLCENNNNNPRPSPTYQEDTSPLSRRSRQLLCHQCNRFPLRLQMLPEKCIIINCTNRS